MHRHTLPASALLAVTALALAAPFPVAGGAPCDAAQPISSLPYTITDPGLYCVTQNLSVSMSDGIEVQASGVVIDLHGFELTGDADRTAIRALSTVDNVTVQNGEFSGWKNAVLVQGSNSCAIDLRCNDGAIRLGAWARVERCNVSAQPEPVGIDVGSYGVVRECRVSGASDYGIGAAIYSKLEGCSTNGSTRGFLISDFSTLVDCVANGGDTGFDLGIGIRVEHCRASGVAVTGFDVRSEAVLVDCTARSVTGGPGFAAGEDSRLVRCTASGCDDGFQLGSRSSAVHCTAEGNDGDGYTADPASIGPFRVEDCIASGNGKNGVRATSGSRVSGCTLEGNGRAGVFVDADEATVVDNDARGNVQAGIQTQGGRSRIEGNHVAGNATGLCIVGTDNLAVQNSLGGNGTAYSIQMGNTRGPVLTFNDWISNTNAWANFNLTFP
jgi:hypothetical protein